VEGATLDAQPYVIEAIEQEYPGLRPWIVDLRKLDSPLDALKSLGIILGGAEKSYFP